MKNAKVLVVITFFFFGVSSLTLGSTISANLDFILYFQEEYSPQFIYPVMLYVLNVVFQAIMIFLGEKFQNPKVVILFSLYLHIVSFVVFPFITYEITNLLGFILCCTIVAILGLGNAMLLSACYSLVSLFPKKYTIAMSIGQGVIGILINIVKYIILFALGEPENFPLEQKREKYIEIGLIFFSFGAGIILLNVFLAHLLFENEHFKNYIHFKEEKLHHNDNSGNSSLPNNVINKNITEERVSLGISDTEQDPDQEENEDTLATSSISKKETRYYKSFFAISIKLLDLNLVLFATFFISFTLFPGIAIDCKNLFGMKRNLTLITILTNFNISDTLGRYLPSFFDVSKVPIKTICILRVIFFFTFPLINVFYSLDIDNAFNNDYFIMINMFLFGCSNGFITSSVMAYGSVKFNFNKREKGLVGTNLIFYLISGVLCGSINAFIYKYLIL